MRHISRFAIVFLVALLVVFSLSCVSASAGTISVRKDVPNVAITAGNTWSPGAYAKIKYKLSNIDGEYYDHNSEAWIYYATADNALDNDGKPQTSSLLVKKSVNASEATFTVAIPQDAVMISVQFGWVEDGRNSLTLFDGEKNGAWVTLNTSTNAISVENDSLVLYPAQNWKIKVFQPGNTTFTYKSSKPTVATVSTSGKITAKAKGTTVITVRGIAKKTAKIKVKVLAAPKVVLSISSALLRVGETLQLEPKVDLADSASLQTCTWTYKSSNRSVAVVSSTGEITAKKAGTATITVQNSFGTKKTVKVTVKKVVYQEGTTYRALIIGEADYGNPEEDRPCHYHDSKAIKDMLTHCVNEPYQCVKKNDLTAQQVLAEIKSAFISADSDDVSLFFFAGHGCEDGSLNTKHGVITPKELYAALNEIPGRVIVIVQACYSGSLISKASGQTGETGGRFADSLIRAFSVSNQIADHWSDVAPSYGELRTEKFIVIASSKKSQKSCADDYGTYFTRGFVEACGWDMNSEMECTPTGDRNHDKRLTVREIRRVVQKAINGMLTGTGEVQTVRTWPYNSNYILFTLK